MNSQVPLWKVAVLCVGLYLIFAAPKGCDLPLPIPVVSGPRQVLIVHESQLETPLFAGMVRDLRTGPHADYLKSKGHTLTILDQHTPNSPEIAKWQPFTPPELLIIKSGELLKREPLKQIDANAVMSTLKANGG